MKYNRTLIAMFIIGFATTSFAGRGNRANKNLNADKTKNEATKLTENAKRDFKTALISANNIFKSAVKADVAFSSNNKASEFSKSLENLGKTLGVDEVRVILLKPKIESALKEVSNSLEKFNGAMTKAKAGSKTVLSKEAFELIQANEVILKLISEAVKTGKETSFKNITKMQESLKNVDLTDSKNIAKVRKELLKIANVDKLEDLIKCKI